jgi:hypothetical protein
MISINTCAKCGAVVCACGFAATLAVAVLGGGKPPPPRVVGPIAAQFTPLTPGTLGLSTPQAFLAVADEINGKVYSAPWSSEPKKGTEVTGASPASIRGSLDGVPASLVTVSSIGATGSSAPRRGSRQVDGANEDAAVS